MVRHRIICGDSATFQGDERDIVFLSMIADRKRKQSQTAMQYEQRFNVALSRARDRMVLVRSVTEIDLNPNDLKAKVIRHFREPMPSANQAGAALIDLCQSGFERELFSVLIERGYRVIPQVGSQGFSIDMVVEGESGRRLAIECDGDLYHGPDRWADDMRRQRILERVGWTFWRCFGSNYSLDREGALDDLIQTLDRMGIKPIGGKSPERKYTEHRTTRAKAVVSPTFSTGAGRRRILGLEEGEERVGSTTGFRNSPVVETKYLFRIIVLCRFASPCICARIDASRTARNTATGALSRASAAPAARWCSGRRSISAKSTTVSRKPGVG